MHVHIFLGNVFGIIYWIFLEELPQLRSRPRLSSPPITSKRPAKRTSSAWWGSAVFWPKIVLTVSWKSMTSLTSKASFYIYASVIARKEGIWTTVLQSNLTDIEFTVSLIYSVPLYSTVWKNENFTLIQKIFRQINTLVTTLLSRNFCQKMWKFYVNFRIFHTVCLVSIDLGALYHHILHQQHIFCFRVTIEPTNSNLPLKPISNGQHPNGTTLASGSTEKPQQPLAASESSSTKSSFVCDWLVGHRLRALLVKNFIRMWRNLGFLTFQFIIPTVQVTLFCLAIGRDPTDLTMAVRHIL